MDGKLSGVSPVEFQPLPFHNAANQTSEVIFAAIIPRFAGQTLRAKLATSLAVVLLGPRQVGKITTARGLVRNWSTETLYLDMERPADRRRLDDADVYLRGQQGKLVIIDEIHRVPGLFEILRGIINDRRAAGARFSHFLLLGSAGIELMRQASETLVGWIAILEIQPLAILAQDESDRCRLHQHFHAGRMTEKRRRTGG